MQTHLIAGLLAIPLVGTFASMYAHIQDLGVEHAAKKVLLPPLLISLILGCCAAILGLASGVAWDAPSLLAIPIKHLTLLVAGAGATVLFLLAMAVEAKNRGNRYTIKKRFAKFSLQNAAGACFCAFVGVAILSLSQKLGIEVHSLTCFAPRFAALLFTAITAYGGYALVRSTQNAVWAIFETELRPNSKRLKLLRRSPKA